MNINFRNILLLLSVFLLAFGCVANRSVQTVQAGDYEKSCDQLKYELSDLGAKFEEAKSDSGITGKNVGLAVVFWPGIIVNEVTAGKNQKSIDGRISHLTKLYSEKCISDK